MTATELFDERAGAAPQPVRPAAGGAVTLALGVAAVVALATTYALGLALPETVEQGDHSRLIAIHPGLAWASYVAFGVTALASAAWLWPRTRRATWDHLAGASAEVGVVFTALTLVTGSDLGSPDVGGVVGVGRPPHVVGADARHLPRVPRPPAGPVPPPTCGPGGRRSLRSSPCW
jgi:hypothetical protein